MCLVLLFSLPFPSHENKCAVVTKALITAHPRAGQYQAESIEVTNTREEEKGSSVCVSLGK